jgi:hypothetical protein
MFGPGENAIYFCRCWVDQSARGIFGIPTRKGAEAKNNVMELNSQDQVYQLAFLRLMGLST